MKPRHAAALALVGWYLMFPNSQKGVTYNSPLSQWDSFGKEFKSKKDCEKGMKSDRKYWLEQTRGGDYSNITMGFAPYVSALFDRKAVCVRSDDPRLKPK